MKSFNDLSIKIKLNVIIQAAVIVTLAYVSGFLIYQKIASYNAKLQSELDYISSLLSSRSNAALIFNDDNLLNDNLKSLELNQSIDLACIYDQEMNVRATLSKQKDTTCPNTIIITNPSSWGRSIITKDITYEQNSIGWIHIQANKESLIADLKTSGLMIIVMLFFSSYGGVAFSRFISKHISNRIEELSQATKDFTEGKQHSENISNFYDDEIGQLTLSFTTMMNTIVDQNKAISEHNKNLEIQVDLRTEELRLANEELEAFTFSASHDLKAPINDTTTLLNEIAADEFTQLSPKSIRHFNELKRINRKAYRTLDGIMRLSRVSKQEITISAVDFSQLCKRITERQRYRYTQQETEVHIEDITLFGDLYLLEILATNLIENAFKYSSNTNNAKISITNIQNGFCIEDNGAGFNPRFAGKLYTPFKRLHGADEFNGDGIGLATVKRIIDRHNWKIKADSTPGRGAKFTIYFK